ncbi:CesT family type III secretion system chaperone [bacterium BD-1]|nr:CesT family type III secretion system chaperone [Ottowia caeni]
MNPAYPALLSAFADAVGLPDAGAFLKTEEVVVDDITVSIYYEGDESIGEVVCFSMLGKPDAADLPKVSQVLLEANYLWAGTGGATLGMSPEDQKIMCAVRLQIDGLTGESLASTIDAFVDTASFWKRWIAGEVESKPAPGMQDFQMQRI